MTRDKFCPLQFSTVFWKWFYCFSFFWYAKFCPSFVPQKYSSKIYILIYNTLYNRNIVCIGKCTFEEIDIDLCNKFREYLLTAKKLRRNGRITRNSASGYWSTFRGLLKILYRNGLIRTNVNDFLEKIETEDVVKDYLSVEELYKLAETPCKKPLLKTASLFSCMTSLRISDILARCWEDIVDYSVGGGVASAF